MKLKDKFIVLNKVSDNRFNGDHPNGINVGYKLKGWVLKEPAKGEPLFLFATKSIKSTPTGWTSVIKKVDIENMLLETKNSTYSVTIDEAAEDFKLEDLQSALSLEIQIKPYSADKNKNK